MRSIFLALTLACLAPACVTHSHITNFSGVDGIRGEPIEFQITTSYSLHFLYVFGIVGDAGKESTVEEFTAEASERGATRVRLVVASTEVYWYLLLPFTVLVQPVVTTVAGEVEGTIVAE
jgi:hypothetical protein